MRNTERLKEIAKKARRDDLKNPRRGPHWEGPLLVYKGRVLGINQWRSDSFDIPDTKSSKNNG